MLHSVHLGNRFIHVSMIPTNKTLKSSDTCNTYFEKESSRFSSSPSSTEDWKIWKQNPHQNVFQPQPYHGYHWTEWYELMKTIPMELMHTNHILLQGATMHTLLSSQSILLIPSFNNWYISQLTFAMLYCCSHPSVSPYTLDFSNNVEQCTVGMAGVRMGHGGSWSVCSWMSFNCNLKQDGA